jgi:hypothetical protein
MQKAKSIREQQLQQVVHSLEQFDVDLAHRVALDLEMPLNESKRSSPQRARASSLPDIYSARRQSFHDVKPDRLAQVAALRMQCAWRGHLGRRRSLDALWSAYEAQEQEMQARKEAQVRQGLRLLEMEAKKRARKDAAILARDKSFVRVHAAVRIQRVFKQRIDNTRLVLQRRRQAELAPGRERSHNHSHKGSAGVVVGNETKSETASASVRSVTEKSQSLRERTDKLNAVLIQELERRNELLEEKAHLERTLNELVGRVDSRTTRAGREKPNRKPLLGSPSGQRDSRDSAGKMGRAAVLPSGETEDRMEAH